MVTLGDYHWRRCFLMTIESNEISSRHSTTTDHKFFSSTVKLGTQIQNSPLELIVLVVLGVDIRQVGRSSGRLQLTLIIEIAFLPRRTSTGLPIFRPTRSPWSTLSLRFLTILSSQCIVLLGCPRVIGTAGLISKEGCLTSNYDTPLFRFWVGEVLDWTSGSVRFNCSSTMPSSSSSSPSSSSSSSWSCAVAGFFGGYRVVVNVGWF